MKVPAPTPDKKRKSSASTEREEGVNKLAKLDNKEQASYTEVPKEDQHTKPNPSGQVVQSPEMFQATLNKLSPSKQTMEAGGAAAQGEGKGWRGWGGARGQRLSWWGRGQGSSTVES